MFSLKPKSLRRPSKTDTTHSSWWANFPRDLGLTPCDHGYRRGIFEDTTIAYQGWPSIVSENVPAWKPAYGDFSSKPGLVSLACPSHSAAVQGFDGCQLQRSSWWLSKADYLQNVPCGWWLFFCFWFFNLEADRVSLKKFHESFKKCFFWDAVTK